jgi:hypothetical protein
MLSTVHVLGTRRHKQQAVGRSTTESPHMKQNQGGGACPQMLSPITSCRRNAGLPQHFATALAVDMRHTEFSIQ